MSGRLFDPPPVLTERQWQTILQKALTREGWAFNHIYRSKMMDGSWRTTTTAVGWPDLTAIRAEFILAIEVKAAGAPPPPRAQIEWLTRFAGIPTGLAWVLTPRDSWQEVANWIAHPWAAPKIHGWQPGQMLASTEETTTTRR